MQEKEQTTDEAGNQQISNSKVEDNGAKLIFENPTLCAQLLRDYSNIDLLKNVQAEDITDVTERYIPMFTEERNADVVKQVRVGDNDEVFVTLIEHKSQVDYNVSMQILRYMVYIWEDYEKRQEKKIPGVSKLAGFKYPPIFPIVYYNGEETWTADNFLKSRIALSDIFLPYVPDYKYHLVNTADHDKDELIEKNDGLSLLMILNKVRNSEEFNSLNLPREYVDNLSANAPEDVLDVLARVIAVLLRKHRVSEDEIQDFVSQIKERRMSDLFANFKASFNVMEERKIGQDKGELLNQIRLICKKLSKGKDLETILDELEADDEIAEKEISEIVNVAQNYAPEYDEEKIYDELEKTKKAD
ncbi:MAG: Rpn family recombination-promoting nuclease/putative transposase [Butyrivibrio sp.]|uniref:Rpn family recombination-promoting nuclease/putative transposase n=1 Tax=Butyrivibrio sp. TaxID=28121 RepID=UPI0025BC991F|nr:Rpn family recombination-promoting nuclease/putative transposase [Butyrivibrio sp.]MBQ6589711.1 Rpn family recombination-promoting nuclease/putative transposase [Butyrivibrio sp.]